MIEPCRPSGDVALRFFHGRPTPRHLAPPPVETGEGARASACGLQHPRLIATLHVFGRPARCPGHEIVLNREPGRLPDRRALPAIRDHRPVTKVTQRSMPHGAPLPLLTFACRGRNERRKRSRPSAFRAVDPKLDLVASHNSKLVHKKKGRPEAATCPGCTMCFADRAYEDTHEILLVGAQEGRGRVCSDKSKQIVDRRGGVANCATARWVPSVTGP